MPERFAAGRARFGGVDVRWMKDGVLLRGEWLGGRPFDGTATTGGYVDVIVHRPGHGTGDARSARAERLAYDAQPPLRALHPPLFGRRAHPALEAAWRRRSGVGHQAGQLHAAPTHGLRRRRSPLAAAGRPLSRDDRRARPHRRCPGIGGSRRGWPLAVALLVAARWPRCSSSPPGMVSRQSREPRRRSSSRPRARRSTACSRAARAAAAQHRRGSSPSCRSSARTSPTRGWPPTAPPSTRWPTAIAVNWRRTFAIVTDAAGAGWPARAGPRRRDGAAARTGAGDHRGACRHDPRPRWCRRQTAELFLVVTAPARFADEVLGTLVGRLRADRRPGAGAGAGWRSARSSCCPATATSPPPASLTRHWPIASALVADAPRAGRRAARSARGPADRRYVGGTFPLAPDAARRRRRAVSSCSPTGSRRQQFVDQLRDRFLLAASCVFGLALALGLVFSRRVSRPLRDIAAAASDIAGGNLALQLPVRGSAEAMTRGAGLQRHEREPARWPTTGWCTTRFTTP